MRPILRRLPISNLHCKLLFGDERGGGVWSVHFCCAHSVHHQPWWYACECKCKCDLRIHVIWTSESLIVSFVSNDCMYFFFLFHWEICLFSFVVSTHNTHFSIDRLLVHLLSISIKFVYACLYLTIFIPVDCWASCARTRSSFTLCVQNMLMMVWVWVWQSRTALHPNRTIQCRFQMFP